MTKELAPRYVILNQFLWAIPIVVVSFQSLQMNRFVPDVQFEIAFEIEYLLQIRLVTAVEKEVVTTVKNLAERIVIALIALIMMVVLVIRVNSVTQ